MKDSSSCCVGARDAIPAPQETSGSCGGWSERTDRRPSFDPYGAALGIRVSPTVLCSDIVHRGMNVHSDWSGRIWSDVRGCQLLTEPTTSPHGLSSCSSLGRPLPGNTVRPPFLDNMIPRARRQPSRCTKSRAAYYLRK
jgi:hypothetical protein